MEEIGYKSESKDSPILNINPKIRTMLKRWITHEYKSVQRKGFNAHFVS